METRSQDSASAYVRNGLSVRENLRTQSSPREILVTDHHPER
jgi:hypothetical protein